MTDTTNIELQQKRLFKKAKQGKAVLFLGAGASVSSGGPIGSSLAQLINAEFLTGAARYPDDLIEVCNQVLDTPGIDRTQLEEFIRKKLDVQPSAAHLALCRTRWQAIFTTNFDDLVEAAYRRCPDKVQRCDVIFDGDFSRRQSDYTEVVRLFKLMGSVDGTEERSRMALNRSDYNKKLRNRGGLFKSLSDFARDGTIVYIGYSFADRIARDLIDEVRDEVGEERLPWGWALLPSWEASTEQILRERKILPLQMTFEAFVEKVAAMPEEDDVAETPAVSISVSGISVAIPQPDFKMYARQFEFLYDEIGMGDLGDDRASKRNFFEGKTDPWVGIRRGWAFRRNVTVGLLSRLRHHLKRLLDRELPVILLTGPAGSGKTTLARLVAYELFKRDGYAVIFLKADKEQIDYLIIDSFARYLASTVEADSKEQEPLRVPLLIIVDEAAAKLQDVRRLPQYLLSRGVAATILAVARENEWKLVQGENPMKVTESLSLDDTLISSGDGDEAMQLLGHLRSIDLLDSAHDEAYWVRRISHEYQRSFSTTLYYLVEPTRPPIAQSVRNEYDRLLPLAQTAYRYVCIFYQFGIPLDQELLARALGRSYNQFVESVYNPASLGVIIEEEEFDGESRFRARSRMTAERVIEYAYPEANGWLSDLETIAGSLLPHNVNEVATVRNLLIHWIGPNGTARLQDAAGPRAVFEAALKAGMRDSATLHHFGLLLLDQQDFEGARGYLTEALRVVEDNRERSHFRTESRQNIYNSLGMAAAKHGLYLDRTGGAAAAGVKFTEAVEFFRAARTGEYMSSYPFYSEAWMLFARAKTLSGNDRLRLIGKAFEVLDQSEGNVDEEGKASLAEMEGKIIAYLSEIPDLDRTIESLIEAGEPEGEYLKARQVSGLYKEGFDLKSAYFTVMEALDKAPNNLPCLRLAARLHIQVLPGDWEDWLKLLKRRFDLEGGKGQAGLLFDLGYACSQLGRYNEAHRYFEELEVESEGHPRRSGIIKVVSDGGKPRLFTGIVKQSLSRWEGWLRCDVIGQELKFFPLKQKFTVMKGQTVQFQLALNYRGFLASELRPA